jgi:hypothetical protein
MALRGALPLPTPTPISSTVLFLEKVRKQGSLEGWVVEDGIPTAEDRMEAWEERRHVGQHLEEVIRMARSPAQTFFAAKGPFGWLQPAVAFQESQKANQKDQLIPRCFEKSRSRLVHFP